LFFSSVLYRHYLVTTLKDLSKVVISERFPAKKTQFKNNQSFPLGTKNAGKWPVEEKTIQLES